MKTMRKKPVIFILALLGFLSFPPFAGYWNIRVAQQALRQGEYRHAYESFSRAAKLLPWRADLYEQAGLAAGYNHEYAKAIGFLKQPGELSESGWAMLAAFHFYSNELHEAIQAYQDGLERYPESRDLHAGLAYLYRYQEEWEQELLAVESQSKYDPENPAVLYRLGLLYAIFNPEQATAVLARASDLDPGLDPAFQTLRAALAESSISAEASRQKVVIGRALGLLNEWELAEYVFQQAAEINADNAEAWAWLGEAKQQNGEDGGAELIRALTLNPKSASIHALRGLYWGRQKEYGNMLAEYLQAAQWEPENPAWQASAADAYFRLGNLNEAVLHYQRAAALAPDVATYHRLLAVFCADNGVYLEELALPAALKAVEIAPDDPAALDALGYVYFSTGRFANAEASFARAIELDSRYFPAHLHLAMNYLAQGNRAAAFNELTLVRDADASGLYAETARRMLEQYFP